MTHLQVRSWFSFSAGASSPTLLAHCAANYGQSARALTDTCTLAGAVRLSSCCAPMGTATSISATSSHKPTRAPPTAATLFPGRFVVELVHHERAGDNERLRHLLELADTPSLTMVATNAVRLQKSATG